MIINSEKYEYSITGMENKKQTSPRNDKVFGLFFNSLLNNLKV